MERKAVADGKSKQIKSIGYENGTLEIEFSSGGVYQYSGVPQSLYEEFVKADSLGAFVASRIRGVFEYKRLHKDGLTHAGICLESGCWCEKLTKSSREEEKKDAPTESKSVTKRKATQKKLRTGI
jgi:KTSC domain